MSKRNHLPDSWSLVLEAQKVFLVQNKPGFFFSSYFRIHGYVLEG